MKSRTPNRFDISPNKVQRSRQFSQVRLGHSKRLKTSHIGTTSNANNSMIQPTPREQNKAKRNANNQSQVSLSPAKVVCVGCFNKELGQAKLNKKKQQSRIEYQRPNTSLINTDDQYHNQAKSRYMRQFQLTNKYNKEKIMKDREKKEKEKGERQRSTLQAEQLFQYNKQLELKKAQLQHEKVQQLRKDLRQQIQKKKIKQSIYKNQQKQPIQPMFDLQNRRQMQIEIQQKYKREIKQQIQQNKRRKQKKQQQQEKLKKQAEMEILNQAVEKQRLKREQIERRQRAIDEENKKRKELQQLKEKKRKQQDAQEQNQTRNNIKLFQQQKKVKEQIRKKKIDQYVEDIKKQMNYDQDKKRKQYAWLHQPTRIALIQKQDPPQRTCDSCEKRYPQSYLTKINSPLKF